jgi:hypothetical protein
VFTRRKALCLDFLQNHIHLRFRGSAHQLQSLYLFFLSFFRSYIPFSDIFVGRYFTFFIMAKLLLALGLLGLASMVNAAPTSAPIARAVRTKRGLPYNDGALTKLFHVGGSKISWMYNWDSTTSGTQSGWNYVPVLHSDDPGHTGRWNANVNKAIKKGATHVLSFNEPD